MPTNSRPTASRPLFADSFFRNESRRNNDKLSPEQLKQKIDAFTAQQETLQKRFDDALVRQKADAEQEKLQNQKFAADRAGRLAKELDIEVTRKRSPSLEQFVSTLEQLARKPLGHASAA